MLIFLLNIIHLLLDIEIGSRYDRCLKLLIKCRFFSFHRSQSLRIHLRQASLNIPSKQNYFSAKTLTFVELMPKIFLI